MPWCPKYKTEYRKGFTVCSDCNSPLVEKLVDEEMVPFFQAEEKRIADKLVRYFEFSGLPSDIQYYEDNQIYVVSVPAKKQKEAKKLYQAFYFVEREKAEKEGNQQSSEPSETSGKTEENDTKEQADRNSPDIPMKTVNETENALDMILEDTNTKDTSDTAPEDTVAKDTTDMVPEDSSTKDMTDTVLADIGTENTADTTEETNGSSSVVDEAAPEYNADEEPVTYVLKSEQYKDLNSTFWIFLLFGIAGILILVLNLAGIFDFVNGVIPNIVMGALFLFFLYVALSTHHKAKKIQAEIKAENELTEKISQWLAAHITKEFLSSIHIDSISPELNYMRTCETIHDMLIKEFGPQNNAYLDRLLEEFYNRTFDSKQ